MLTWLIIKERKVNGFQVGNVCGYVRLGKEWHVTKNKNGLMHDGHALFAAVEKVLTPMLKRAQAQAMTHRCSALMGDVTSTINAALGVADEKAVRRRNDDPKKGTKTALVSHAAWLIAAEACANEDPQLSIKGFRSSDISVDDLSSVVAAILDGVREVNSVCEAAE